MDAAKRYYVPSLLCVSVWLSAVVTRSRSCRNFVMLGEAMPMAMPIVCLFVLVMVMFSCLLVFWCNGTTVLGLVLFTRLAVLCTGKRAGRSIMLFCVKGIICFRSKVVLLVKGSVFVITLSIFRVRVFVMVRRIGPTVVVNIALVTSDVTFPSVLDSCILLKMMFLKVWCSLLSNFEASAAILWFARSTVRDSCVSLVRKSVAIRLARLSCLFR